MSNIAITVESLGKSYRIGVKEKAPTTLREKATKFIGAPFKHLKTMRAEPTPEEVIWALRDISFDVRDGEVIGIIGLNGAGKSTLLKILTRITEPTVGQARLRGRVGALLEIGTGFHPELTGRENVYLNGAVLGMKRVEIKRKFDEIVDFSGVEHFIDTPVKRYSSGMRVRLGFSVAAHLEPEILLVDEVLAVGDAAFQKKCLGKMDDVASQGRTILFVSHNMESIINLCSRTIWLESGKIKDEGPSGKIVREYLAATREHTKSTSLAERTDRRGNGNIRFTKFELRNEKGAPIKVAHPGDTVDFALHYVANPDTARHVRVSIDLIDNVSRKLTCFSTNLTGENFESLPSKGEIICRVPRFPLVPGIYTIDLSVKDINRLADRIHNAAVVEIAPGDFFGTGKTIGEGKSVFMCENSWKFTETQ